MQPACHAPPKYEAIDFGDGINLEESKIVAQRQLIKKNKTDPKINELVAKNFRIKMAINTIKNTKGVQDAA